jgi:hypothetical protein
MNYIEYNNINYFIQEECTGTDNEFEQISVKTPIKNDLKSNNIENYNCDYIKNNTNIEKEEEQILLEEIKNNQEFIFTPIKCSEEKSQINTWKNEINEESLNSNKKYEIKNNFVNTSKKSIDEIEKNLKISEVNNINENLFKKKFELLESNDIKYKKFFVINQLVFSKVEIQGIVIDKKIYGFTDDKNMRIRLFIDDSTGIIEVLAWRSNRENLFYKLRDQVVILFNNIYKIKNDLNNKIFIFI